MTTKENYHLTFSKVRSRNIGFVYTCTPNDPRIEGSATLSNLLEHLADDEAKFLLEEVNLVISGAVFQDNYSLNNGAHVWVDFEPPNALISDIHLIPLTDLKELLEEWIAYVELKEPERSKIKKIIK
ncbi:MAG: hypothetical protein GQ574_08900 [Crocinitomix sp.]|nr:hypothetical protein [Crocinitomix sp.]